MNDSLAPTVLCVCLPMLVASCASGSRLEVEPIDPEGYADWASDGLSSARLLEHLNELLEHPLDLNRATSAELLSIPGLEPAHVREITEFRRTRSFRTLADLLTLESISEPLLARVSPFLSVAEQVDAARSPVVSFWLRSRSEAYLHDGPEAPASMSGSRWKNAHRLLIEMGGRSRHTRMPTVSLGMLVEKDAGEARWADHLSGYVTLRSDSCGLEVVAGDFAVEGALGIVSGSRSSSLQGDSPLGARRWRTLMVRPRATSSESGVLRGLCVAYRRGIIEAAAYYSNRGVHARLDDSSAVSSLYEAGLFRTPSEESLRFRTRERRAALRVVSRVAANAHAAVSFSDTRFSHELRIASLHGRSERRFGMIGVDAAAELERMDLAGEAAWDFRGNKAFMATLRSHLGESLEAALSLRHVTGGFVNLHGSPCADRANSPGGESGASIGVYWKISPALGLRFLADQFRNPSSIGGAFSGGGADWFAQLDLKLPASVAFEFRVRQRNIRETTHGVDVLGRTVALEQDRITRTAGASLSLRPDAAIRLKSSCDVRELHSSGPGTASRGLAVAHQLSWKMCSWAQVELRISSFHTEKNTDGFVTWEGSVQGSVAQTLYLGQGIRWSVLARLRVAPLLVGEVKYSETDRNEEIETGGRTVPQFLSRRHLVAQIELHL